MSYRWSSNAGGSRSAPELFASTSLKHREDSHNPAIVLSCSSRRRTTGRNGSHRRVTIVDIGFEPEPLVIGLVARCEPGSSLRQPHMLTTTHAFCSLAYRAVSGSN